MWDRFHLTFFMLEQVLTWMADWIQDHVMTAEQQADEL